MNKAEAVVIIRSLLSTIKSPIGINGLNKMFRNETGIDIPLFEHMSITDFLSSIPDTVLLTGEYPNQVVNLVRSNKSAHVVSLVKKEKKCTKNSQRKKMFYKSTNYFPELINNESFDYDSKEKISSCIDAEKCDKENLYEHLTLSQNGATLNEIQKIVCKFAHYKEPLTHNNILSIIKCFPFCLFYEGKFYAIEIFKQKILNNDNK